MDTVRGLSIMILSHSDGKRWCIQINWSQRGLCCRKMSVCASVCLSVCLSVTRQYSIETAKRILKLLSPSGSHTILVSPHQTVPILIFKIFICRRGMVQESCWMHLPTRVGNLEVSIVCWRESIRRVQLPSTRQRQTAFGAERWRILCSVRSTSEKRIDQLVRFHMKLAFPV